MMMLSQCLIHLSHLSQEFTYKDNVELYILTKPFLTGSNFMGDMHAWAEKHLNITDEKRPNMPTLYVIDSHLTALEYSGLYKVRVRM